MKGGQFQFLLLALGIGVAPAWGQEGKAVEAQAAARETASGSRAVDNGNTTLVRIERFEVKGNTLLAPELIERILSPYKGENRSYTDIQLALETLEGAYRKAGYSAVHVLTPEQEITAGTVLFQVMETVVGKVTLKGNRYYDKGNIRNALPALVEGYTPSARKLSENIRLANENPTRQIDVVLALGEEENTVDAQVNVVDSSPRKFFVTVDNTGSQSTGMYRVGVGIQHNNLFNRDQAATFNYVTSPGHVQDVKQVSASYRIPLYSTGDSVDLIAARSDTNAGTSPIVGGYLLTFSGKGNVYGAHYNHYLPRYGDYASRLAVGLDYRAYFNNCQINGAAVCGASGNDLSVFPVSVSYGGTLTKAAYIADYTAAIVRNLPGSARGGSGDFAAARAAGTKADYSLLRVNGSLMGLLPQDWQYRAAGNLQYTRDALVTYESIGLVGANAVRGFLEREVSDDRGAVLNLELYTPELAPKLHLESGSLRLLGFVDRARGWKVALPGEAAVQDSVGSVGLGFRYVYGKYLTAKFDWAKVTGAGGGRKTGDSRGQVSVMASW